ncbi:SRPBCC family protein [Salegentibacter chungangensis]|uniref:GyrI-like domain-containing protein n=1 Tax=Salegentibacter chungangensis TaxID=1335724 RepID=A0ABW3NS09_9FLAO
MKILKYLLFLILIIIIAGSIYVATKDGEFQVEQTKVIEAPREMVYNEVNNYKNWENWEPWSQESEDMVVNYFEKTKGEGAGYMWKSEDMGDGQIRTTEATPFSKINQIISFDTPFGETSSQVYWEFEEAENGTKVTWGMKGEQSFTEKLIFSFQDQSISEMMLPMFDKGLENMETVILNKMKEYNISVDGIIQHGGGYYMYTTTASKMSQVDERMQKMIADVSSYMEQNNIEKTGNPFVLYNEWNDEKGTAIFSAGIFTSSEVITPAESMILNDYLPNQKVVKTTLKGDYKNLKEAWDKTYAYILENGLEVNSEANPFEVYLTSPEHISNPAKWVTHIYVPVK